MFLGKRLPSPPELRTDPTLHISTHKEDVSPEEIKKRMDAMKKS